MNGTTYVVTLALQTQGNFGAQVGHLGQNAAKSHSQVSTLGHGLERVGDIAERMGSKAGSALEGFADTVGSAVATVAKLGAAAGVGLATYGVAKLNNELEQTQLSLGAIAQAQGFATTFGDGFAMAGAQLKAMKQDVKTLPGDLGQLSDLMKMIATPAAQGGANLDQIRKLAGRTMLTSTILGVPQEVASREMAGLLSGRAGAHNILGSRLGLIGEEAQKFNKMTPEARLSKINQELDKYSGAADKFGQSFIANFTTLKDNLKYSILAETTAPLFERVKAGLVSINSWFDHNQDRVQAFSRIVGGDLANAWDRVVGIIAKVEPMIGRAVNTLGKLNASRVEGYLSRGAMGLVGTKIAGRALEGGGSILGSVLSGAGSAAKLAGSAPAMEAVGTALTFLSNPVTLAAAAAAIGLLGVTAVAVGGAVHALTDETSAFHERAVALWSEIVSVGEDAFGRLQQSASSLYTTLVPVADQMGTTLLFALREMAPILGMVASGAEAAASGLRHMLQVISKIPGYGNLDPDAGGASGGTGRGQHSWGQSNGKGGTHGEALTLEDVGAKAAAKIGAGGGGGGTKIGKVEIHVEGAGDPSRIAHLVMEHMQKLAANPKSSPYVPSYIRDPVPIF